MESGANSPEFPAGVGGKDGGGEFSSTVSNSSSSGVSSGSGNGGGGASCDHVLPGVTSSNGRGSSGVDSGAGGISPVGGDCPDSNESGIKRPAATATAPDGANQFYGLHALNNLDIAVNGKGVNAMPSYQEVRRRSNANLDSSGGSAEYSPPQPRDAFNSAWIDLLTGLFSSSLNLGDCFYL